MNTKCPAIVSMYATPTNLPLMTKGEPTLEAVPQEAAKSLVNTANHAVWTKAETLAGHRTSIDVRDGNGALLQHAWLNDQDNKL